MAHAMQALTFALASHNSIPLTWREALSGIFGSISLAAWIFVFIPQLYGNYVTKDASGISLLFLLVWMFGDVTNLIGSLWARLVPTVVALAVYFCFADVLLILQVLYYNYWYNRGQRLSSTTEVEGQDEEEEETPLLGRRGSGSSLGLPGSHKRRRRSSVLSKSSVEVAGPAGNGLNNAALHRVNTLERIAEGESVIDPPHNGREWLLNALGLVGVCVVGAVGWLICFKLRVWTPAPREPLDGHKQEIPVGAEILGYISAVAYLGARIPQILKNWRDQSCEGLSLLFFLLSLLGNLTYGAGILFHSTEREYVIKNIPWLLGSLGTMVEDVTIFFQFRMYGNESRKKEPEEAIE